MSFSQEVRNELSNKVAKARHCNLAELAEILQMAGEIRRSKDGRAQIRIRTENQAVARKSFTLLQKAFNIVSDVSVSVHKGVKKSERIYSVAVQNPKEAGRILSALKMSGGEETVDPLLVQQSCCRRACIRGAFLSAGSISDPRKSYHFEIVCAGEPRALQLKTLIQSFGPDPRIARRKNHFILYLKEGDQIVDMLNIMEAHVALMNLENVRIVRDMRNAVNRQVNCEAANINKTVNAAVRQTEDIRYLEDVMGLEQLPEGLTKIAELRLANPDATLKELGEMLVPPIGKSGVNHRLRKLSQIADEVRRSRL